MAGSSPLAITQGKNTDVFIALLDSGDRVEPTSVTFTTSASAASNATQIAVGSQSTKMIAGNYILFKDASDLQYVAKVTANYTSGTLITVAALSEAIPISASAVFPPGMRLRTTADIDASTNAQTVNTYDHSVNGDAAIGATSRTFKADGLFSSYDPALRIAEYAQGNAKEVYIRRVLDTPNATVSTTGREDKGSAILTSLSIGAPNENAVTANMAFQFTSYTSEDPLAA